MSRMNSQTFSWAGSSGHLAGGQRNDRDVVRHDEMLGEMPGGLIDQQGCVPSRRDLRRDCCQVERHCLGVAGGQDQAAAFAVIGADGAKYIGGCRALVLRGRWPGAPLRPARPDPDFSPMRLSSANQNFYPADTGIRARVRSHPAWRGSFFKSLDGALGLSVMPRARGKLAIPIARTSQG